MGFLALGRLQLNDVILLYSVVYRGLFSCFDYTAVDVVVPWGIFQAWVLWE
jgi:hypothetical protein